MAQPMGKKRSAEVNYFQRQVQLWGEEVQASLKNKRIAIVGSGGLGCSLGIGLGSSGIGEIHVVDFDTVSLHNIHRQIAFKLEDEGKPKAQVLFTGAFALRRGKYHSSCDGF